MRGKKKALKQEETRSGLKQYLVHRYEEDARNKNKGEKIWAQRELQQVFELIERNSKPRQEKIDNIKAVKNKGD